jgi:hypothetical protein
MHLSFSEFPDAKEAFIECINTGGGGEFYDARVAKECGLQLQSIIGRDANMRLERFLSSFEHKHRDFVFLVNDSSEPNERGCRISDRNEEVV